MEVVTVMKRTAMKKKKVLKKATMKVMLILKVKMKVNLSGVLSSHWIGE